MKIVCEACSAKYSISDDKVQGKVFKIRCKKCSNIIVVRGNAGAGVPSEATTLDKSARVLDYGGEGEDQGGGGDAVWHVVIDQDQVGPMTAADVQRRFQAGEIDGDTYIWREGFADWLPVSQVDQFSALFSGAAASEPAASFAAPAAAAKSPGASAVSDLFGQDTAASTPEDDGEVFGARRPAAAADNPSKLRGERGENSVLFSLSNLAQLASDPPRSSSSSSSASSAPASSAGAAQHGGGEGSGLIDIRSMASAYLTDKGPKAASPAVGSAADLPVFSSTGFGESAAVLMPISRPAASNNNRLLYGLVGLVGLLAVVAVVMVVVVLKGDSKPQVVAANTPSSMGGAESAGSTKESPEPGSPSGAVKEPASAAGATTEPPAKEPATTTEPAAKEPATREPAKEPATREPSTREPSKPRDTTKKPSSSSSTKPAAKEPDEPKAPPPPKKGSDDCDAVACLVDPSQACCKKSGGSKPSSGSSGSKADSNLPEQLDSSMIKAGIDKVKGRAQACGSKSSAKGSVKVRIKATPDGKVGSVEVVSSPDDALGSCVASALRGATFAKTQRGMGFAYTLSF